MINQQLEMINNSKFKILISFNSMQKIAYLYVINRYKLWMIKYRHFFLNLIFYKFYLKWSIHISKICF